MSQDVGKLTARIAQLPLYNIFKNLFTLNSVKYIQLLTESPCTYHSCGHKTCVNTETGEPVYSCPPGHFGENCTGNI